MQMHALLVTILLAGGNPVWDQQKPQYSICEPAPKPGSMSQDQKARRAMRCPAIVRPITEAAAPLPAIQAR